MFKTGRRTARIICDADECCGDTTTSGMVPVSALRLPLEEALLVRVAEARHLRPQSDAAPIVPGSARSYETAHCFADERL